jgi:hypothetical protein
MDRWKALAKGLEEVSPLKGGPGSGNFGHSGRPGQEGGSGDGSGGGGGGSSGSGHSGSSWKKHPGVGETKAHRIQGTLFPSERLENVKSRILEGKDKDGKYFEVKVTHDIVKPNGERSPQEAIWTANTRDAAERQAAKYVRSFGLKQPKLPPISNRPKDPDKPITRHPKDHKEIIDHD